MLVLVAVLTAVTVSAQEKSPFKATTDITQDIATRYFDNYMAMDWDRLEPMLHADATFEDPTATLLFGDKKPRGKENVMKNFRMGYESLTGMRAKLARTFFSGDTGIFELDLTFGFRNRQNGITTITMPLVVVIAVKDGKVVSHRDYGDYREYLKQMKAAQEKASQKQR